ncbi:hypothetical protein LCGC14_0694950 [marine sediment metagenome]|uniref:Uncharacterized protein n=1 Tax=marine sediment metagenome TaxID=412755 RepID=A0A0F9QJN7_9ZZZZ
MIVINEKKQYNGWAYLFMWPLGENYIDSEKSNAEILVWCEKNLQGIFEVTDMGLYIYDNLDVMAYKMRWL